MTCAVDFIVERGENVLMVSNAALRYQPTGLSAEKIDDMVFNAGLVNMNDEQRQAAIEARAQAKTTAQNQGQNSNTGLQGLMMGGGQAPRMMGGPGPGGRPPGQGAQGQQAGRQGNRRDQVVMRNLWYIGDDGKLEVMRVRTGISSGSFTEIRSRDEDLEGRQVILKEKI